MDPRWQHPFTCIVAGPTGCGKTTFVARLLRNASAMIDPPPERVTWYYGEWQTAYENLADIPNMRMEEGLPQSFDNDGKRGLVVLDDLMAETGVPIIRRIMSGRMKQQAVCLQMLIKTKNAKLRKAILEHADSELIRALCECAHNILRGNVKMTPREKTRLRKYQTKLRLIARKNVSVKQKRRHLQQTGGFLPALLAPLAASVVIPLLRQLFA